MTDLVKWTNPKRTDEKPDRSELAREAVRLVYEEGQSEERILRQIPNKADRAHVAYHIQKAWVQQRTYDMHLVHDGAVMCGRSQTLNTIPARSIKRPLSLSLAQTQHRQRKLLEERLICPDCWKALHRHIEEAWQKGETR